MLVSKENLNADALSWQPYFLALTEGVAEGEMQVCAVTSQTNIESLLQMEPGAITSFDFSQEQQKNPLVLEIICYLETGEVPAS